MKNKVLFWSGRILVILVILFIMLMSADCFEGASPFSKRLTCFLISNIPSFILIAILIVAQKWETPAGVILIMAAFAMSYFFGIFSGNIWALIVTFPLIVAGVLFILRDNARTKPPDIDQAENDE